MKRINTLVLGLEHFIDKIGYQSSIYNKNGIKVLYIVNDRSGLSSFYAEKYSADVRIVRNGVADKLRVLYKTLFRYKPEFIELYDTGRMSLIYALTALIFRIRLILILRGGEIRCDRSKFLSFNYFKFYVITKIAFRVIIKESNIYDSYVRNKYPVGKVRFVHNAVPSGENITNEDKDIDLLFLNSVRKSRNVLFVAKIACALIANNPSLKIMIAGFNSLVDKSKSYDLEEEERVIEYIRSRNVLGQVQIEGFVSNPEELHRRAKIFLFPADIVFANYSLLEAMSFGVVPLVSNGEGAKLIVNNKNGKILPLDTDDWINEILFLLNHKSILERKSLAARLTVLNKFSLDKWFDQMMDVRK